jgi:predicted CoA-binding protein
VAPCVVFGSRCFGSVLRGVRPVAGGHTRLVRFSDDETVMRLLAYDVWAVVGLTGKPTRPAYSVANWLQRQGKTIIPINPKGDAVLGEQGFRSLAEVPVPVDVVDVFRRSEQAGRHADEAVEIGARGVWFQLGVIDEAAYRRTQDAGIDMVMDVCPAIEGPRLWATTR